MSSTFHARSAAAYEQLMGRWSRRLAAPFVAFADLSGGGRAVDVGCGTGNLSQALAEINGVTEVVGIDLSDIYLAAARADNRDYKVIFQKGDATALPFATGAFDHALSMLVLQFVPDTEKAISEMRRVVRPGGTVAAAVWDSYGSMPAHRMFWDAAALLGLASDKDLREFYFRPMTRPDEMKAAWVRQGLTVVRQSHVLVRMDYDSFGDYWVPIAAGEAALGKFAVSLAATDLDRLEAAVRRSYLGGEPDGPRSFCAMTWVCRGVVV